jgi:hypothetical protein
MSNQPPDDGEHSENIVGVEAYEAPRPPKKNFQPWHRPRKQFVRDRQWCRQIEALLSDVQLEGDVLKYLGLPGVDLLDLRLLYDRFCVPRTLQFRFLGFNNAASPLSESGTELNISLDELRKLPRVDRRSKVIVDDFCLIAKDDSIAWREARALGPYDVVNLDLCDGFCAHAPGVLDYNHYNAIARLLALQARTRNSWLLLLTTRAGSGHVHKEVLQKLLEKYNENLVGCPQFKDESKAMLEIIDSTTLQAVFETAEAHLPVFLVGLCKWIVGLALGQHPPTRVEVKSVIGYQIDPRAAHEDLVSLAIRFEPTFVPARDSLGLAGQTTPEIDECDLSVKVLRRIGKRRNADAILSADGALNDAMISATERLLELARYDVTAYRTWVEQLSLA